MMNSCDIVTVMSALAMTGLASAAGVFATKPGKFATAGNTK